MARRSGLHVLGAVVLFATAACDEYACRWTDEPFPEPIQTSRLEHPYETDDGAFELVLHADGEWPPVVGTTSLRVESARPDPDPPIGPRLFVDRPYLHDGDLVASADPVVVEIQAGEWRIDGLALDAEGIWAVPVWLEDGDIDDSIELYIEVRHDDDE